jgi:hypothetical protein
LDFVFAVGNFLFSMLRYPTSICLLCIQICNLILFKLCVETM